MTYKKYDFCEKEELCGLILTCKIEYEENVTKNTNTSMINWKRNTQKLPKQGYVVKGVHKFYLDLKDAKYGDKNFVKALKLGKWSLENLWKKKPR